MVKNFPKRNLVICIGNLAMNHMHTGMNFRARDTAYINNQRGRKKFIRGLITALFKTKGVGRAYISKNGRTIKTFMILP